MLFGVISHLYKIKNLELGSSILQYFKYYVKPLAEQEMETGSENFAISLVKSL